MGAAGAQGGTTVGEARDVGDATGGHGSLAGAHRLFDGAGTPQEAGAVGTHHLGSVCVDGQLVALITEVGAGRVDREDERDFRSGAREPRRPRMAWR